MTDSNATTPNPNQARGVLAEANEGRVIFSVPGTDYQIYLRPHAKPAAAVGKRTTGTIRARARRVDTVGTGGQYIEPVMGEPRRVQGRVIANDPAANTITVNAGVPIVCELTAGQRADAFSHGDFVSFDVMSGTSFTPDLTA